MTETMTPDKELRVGDGWRYRCWRCNYEVGLDKPFPKTCPGCGVGGWWGHLTTPDITQNLNNVKEGAGDNKNNEGKVSGGIKTRKGILSQQETTLVCAVAQNNGISKPSLGRGRGRGRPLQKVPEFLIKDLDHQGFSSRAMVEELDTRGFKGIGYKTVQRILAGKQKRLEAKART